MRVRATIRSVTLLMLSSTWHLAGAAAPAATTAAGAVIQDCEQCPVLVILPAGEFMMGAAAGEQVRISAGSGAIEQGATQVRQLTSTSLPRHRVTLVKPIAIGRTEITYQQFAAFVAATGYQSDGNDCLVIDVGSDDNLFQQDKYALAQGVRNTSWRVPPSWRTGPDYPVTCVGYNEAEAYVAWLSTTTGRRYRLPSEAEWEYAARAGSTGYWYWGNDPKLACRHENMADRHFLQRRMRTATATNHFDCEDGSGFNAKVGQYAPNAFGLYDMLGNVSELTRDCWHTDYIGAPVDGSAWLEAGDCRFGVLRGDIGFLDIAGTHMAARYGVPKGQYRAQLAGFRVVREL